jgi:membrane-associated phospholipid phosphatase
LFWYAFLGISMVYLCAVDRDTYYRTLLSYVISVLACFVTYYFFQTTVPLRPVLTEDDWLSRLVQYVYQNDQPYNCFPSIHCFSCYLMFKAFRESRKVAPWMRASVQICAVVIILSTLFIKQHVLLDVAGSIFLVEGVHQIVSRLWNTLNISERQFVRRPSRKTVALRN